MSEERWMDLEKAGEITEQYNDGLLSLEEVIEKMISEAGFDLESAQAYFASEFTDALQHQSCSQ